MPPWSSGLGRHPFKVEIAGSNPAGGTTRKSGFLPLSAGRGSPVTSSGRFVYATPAIDQQPVRPSTGADCGHSAASNCVAPCACGTPVCRLRHWQAPGSRPGSPYADPVRLAPNLPSLLRPCPGEERLFDASLRYPRSSSSMRMLPGAFTKAILTPGRSWNGSVENSAPFAFSSSAAVNMSSTRRPKWSRPV